MCAAQETILARSKALWSGCRVMTVAPDRDGYTRVRHGGKRFGSHRLAYEAFVGAIPEGFEVHHECGVRCCVNPAHLQALSRDEHMQTHTDVAGMRLSNATRNLWRMA